METGGHKAYGYRTFTYTGANRRRSSPLNRRTSQDYGHELQHALCTYNGRKRGNTRGFTSKTPCLRKALASIPCSLRIFLFLTGKLPSCQSYLPPCERHSGSPLQERFPSGNLPLPCGIPVNRKEPIWNHAFCAKS